MNTEPPSDAGPPDGRTADSAPPPPPPPPPPPAGRSRFASTQQPTTAMRRAWAPAGSDEPTTTMDAVAPSSPTTASAPGSTAGPAPTSDPAPTAGPPTAAWERPPVSDSPPRPAASTPLGFHGQAGPPLPPNRESDPAAPAPGRRRSRFLRAAGVAVVALSLVSGGFALGTVLSDDDPEPAPAESATRPTANTDTTADSPPVVPEDVPGPLAEDSDTVEPVAAVAAAVSPAVVQIGTSLGQGSGIVWDADAGYIVTNQHVVGESTAVSVRFADGTRVDGEVLGGSTDTDVAVVRVDPDSDAPLVEAVFAPTSSIEVGQLAVAIGSPFGLDQTVTAGIVSAVRINEFGGSDASQPRPVEMVQTDAPINAGNSGGALADREGRVIGMNTSIRTAGVSDGNVGVGFAVPSDTILLIAQRVVDGESLELGFLGVSGSAEATTDGVLIAEVVAGSPAADAGLRVGDVIVALNGEPVGEIGELSAAIKLYRPGEVVDLEIERDGTSSTVAVELGELSE